MLQDINLDSKKKGYGVSACGGVDKLVSDGDQLMFEVTGELD